ncbi:hydroxyacylglutathione hydrolase [Undibacterium luofuense]|nr:hydroxyacylglutathione hydrolase [Undibacterium luofuense]
MLSIWGLPAFDDNYLWIVHNGKDAMAIDPGDAAVVSKALQEHGLQLRAILATHKHADHTGGIGRLLADFPVPVYGSQTDQIPSLTHPVSDGERITIPELHLTLEVIAVPGHTLGHVAYYAASEQALFSGDTLFAGGCGRLFEGSAAQMRASLNKLAALPANTRVYCAHEYTLSNLRFAVAAEPDNPQVAARLQHVQSLRAEQKPSIPSLLADELATNPFLRSDRHGIVATLRRECGLPEHADADASFATLREWKNRF